MAAQKTSKPQRPRGRGGQRQSRPSSKRASDGDRPALEAMRTDNDADREYRQYERREEQDRAGPPDVLLDVPELKVDLIHFELDDLDAHVALKARVLNLVKLYSGSTSISARSSSTSRASRPRSCSRRASTTSPRSSIV